MSPQRAGSPKRQACGKDLCPPFRTGSEAKIARGLLVSLTLSFTHVTVAVLIAVLSLPLISITLGSVGRAPLLEDISRSLLGLIGAWMLWRAIRHAHHHHRHEGEAVGVMAGMIPCPLTLFAMTFAIARGVPVAGILFASTMMIGVAITLSGVAILSVLLRERLVGFFESRPRLFNVITRSIEGVAGAALIGLAIHEILFR